MTILAIRRFGTTVVDTSTICKKCGEDYDLAHIDLDDVEIIDLEMARTADGAAVDVLKCAFVCVCGARVVGKKIKYLATNW